VSGKHSLFALVLLPSQMLYMVLISPSSISDLACLTLVNNTHCMVPYWTCKRGR